MSRFIINRQLPVAFVFGWCIMITPTKDREERIKMTYFTQDIQDYITNELVEEIKTYPSIMDWIVANEDGGSRVQRSMEKRFVAHVTEVNILMNRIVNSMLN